MSHQRELEKKKYRNWVRGGLAYKYLKEGIEEFADDVVQQEHRRILSAVNHTPGVTCNLCCLRNLRPKHKCIKHPTRKNKCPRSQFNCNCLNTKAKPCPHKICDAIMEEILNSHGSSPPTPKWENAHIQKWCSDPWEVAKCYINAPGYSDKTNAVDIDTAGLLHVFINNINLQSHLSDSMNGKDIFQKTLQRRNELFHSPTMEMEDNKLHECIDEIITILEDDKELKARHDAQQAVCKLKQLKQDDFIITTHNEVEVCRTALASITKKSEELKQSIKDAKDDIDMKQAGATKAIDDKMQTALQNALEALANHRDIQTLKQAVELLNKRVNDLESDNSAFRQEMSLIKQRLLKIENNIDTLEAARDETTKKLKFVEEKEELQKRLVELYLKHYVSTSISPLKFQQNNIKVKEVYVAPEMVVEEKLNRNATEQIEPSPNKPNIRSLNGYREILQTSGQKHQQIYIVGDVGTGKSTFCKMMIQHWCSAVTEECPISASNDESENPHKPAESQMDIYPENENINEMKKFEFLFFVHLQRMSGLSDITEMIKAMVADVDLASTDLIDRIFQQESGHCLIVADGLDEYSPQRNRCLLPHVSYGLPKRDRVKHATVVTLSRPSAKGILSMKSSECDQKVELLGIKIRYVESFIETYLSKFNKIGLSSGAFMKKIKTAKLEHLEKTPLLLQQLVWLYCTGNEIGKSISNTYSHIVNIMLDWRKNKEEGCNIDGDRTDEGNQEKDVQLPEMLHIFPRCEANKRLLLPLAGVAFEALTSEKGSSTFSRSHLRTKGLSNDAITGLIKLGILSEENCYDPTEEYTQLEFIHIAYLEFFAAVHVSSHSNEDRKRTNILKDLYLKCKSAADILQLSNILEMICGLSPTLIPELSKFISEIVSRDESMISYRNSIPEYEIINKGQPTQIQRLILNCLSECDSDDQPMVSLCDVIINGSTEMSFLQRIIPDHVLSLHALAISGEEVWKWIAGLKQLQYILIAFSNLSHSEMVLLSSIIQEAPLKRLSFEYVRCTESDCEDLNIGLSKHGQLHELQLRDCYRVKISNINTNLEILWLDLSNILDIKLLLNASRLTELLLGNIFLSRYTYTKQVNYVVHSLQQLRKLRLFRVDIADSALTVTLGMRNLEHIKLRGVSMSQQTWRTFVDSLLTLQQSVQVDIDHFGVCEEWNGDGQSYVRQNEMFEMRKGESPHDFSLRSKKQF